MSITVKVIKESKVNEALDIPPEIMNILTPENMAAIAAMLGVSVAALKSALSSVLGGNKSPEEIALSKAMKGASSVSPELKKVSKSKKSLNKRYKKVGIDI